MSLPPAFSLRINYESLDFVDQHGKPIMQFPFQNILSWGSSSSIFKFNLLDFDKGKKEFAIVLLTSQGREIEVKTMATVRRLMVDMESKTISNDEYLHLISNIFDPNHLELEEGWLATISQFSIGRAFLAKQCMDLMLMIGPIAPFDKTDLACLLFTRILNKESFQLVVNTFDNREDKENLLHFLGNKKGSKGTDSCKNKFTADCQVVKPFHNVAVNSNPTTPMRSPPLEGNSHLSTPSRSPSISSLSPSHQGSIPTTPLKSVDHQDDTGYLDEDIYELSVGSESKGEGKADDF